MKKKTVKIKEKRLFYTEYAYFFGILLAALSTALLASSGLGVSFVDAPAYLLYLKAHQSLQMSYGTATYTFSAFILLSLVAITGKLNRTYLFTFLSTLIYAFTVDSFMTIFGLIPLYQHLWFKIVLIIFATVIGPLGAVLLRHTYITSVVYDYYVREIAYKFNRDTKVVKIIFWLINALLATFLSFYFFGTWVFKGVGIASLVYVMGYYFLFNFWSKMIEKQLHFRDNYKQIKRHFK